MQVPLIWIVSRGETGRIVVLHLFDGSHFGLALGFLHIQFILFLLGFCLGFQRLLLPWRPWMMILMFCARSCRAAM